MANNPCIYKISTTVNHRIYIGSTVNFGKRKSLHLHYLRNNKHHSKILQCHYNKHGEHVLIFDIIEYCSQDQLINREQFYIDSLNPSFNISPTAGNTTGYRHTDETKKIFSAIHKGKIISNKQRISASKKLSGVLKTKTHCKNISRGLIGLKRSESHSRNISIALTGRKLSDIEIENRSNSTNRYKIEQYSQSGILIQVFNSSFLASKILGIEKKAIQKVARGKYKTASGFIFKYIK